VGVIGIIFGIVSQEERSKNLYVLNEETQKVELSSIYLGFMLYNFFQLVYLVSNTGVFRLGSKKSLEIENVEQLQLEEKVKSSSRRKLKIR
jgi:hypothetical protein